MSLGNMFSSNGKQAAQAAQGVAGATQGEVNQVEQYTTAQQQAARDAINGMGANPWFAAGQQLTPSAYAVNPQDTTTFGTSGGPGTIAGAPTTISVNDPTATNPGTPIGTPISRPVKTQPVQIKPNPPTGPPGPGGAIGPGSPNSPGGGAPIGTPRNWRA